MFEVRTSKGDVILRSNVDEVITSFVKEVVVEYIRGNPKLVFSEVENFRSYLLVWLGGDGVSIFRLDVMDERNRYEASMRWLRNGMEVSVVVSEDIDSNKGEVEYTISKGSKVLDRIHVRLYLTVSKCREVLISIKELIRVFIKYIKKEKLSENEASLLLD